MSARFERPAEIGAVVAWGFGIGIPAAWPRLLVVTAAVLVWWFGTRRRAPQAAPGVLVVTASVLWILQGFWAVLPVPLFVVALQVGLLVRGRRVRARRPSAGRRTVAATVLLVAVAVAGSMLWLAGQSNLLWLAVPAPVARGLAVPAAAWLLLIAAAAVNAYAEETIWRRDVLDRVAGSRNVSPTATVASSASFALAHLWAVPDGAAGVALTFGFGLLAATLNRWSGSIVPSFCGHMAADVVLGARLLGLTTTGSIAT